jgi:hypothetical protein
LSVKPISFKGAYKIQGSSEAIDEICWYLQKKKKNQDLNFDFLDIRIAKKSMDETDRILRNASASDLANKDKQDALSIHLLELKAIRNGVMKPFQNYGKKENTDLFLTDKDKKLAENKITNMIEDSLSNILKKMDFTSKVKMLMNNLSQMRNNLSNGKPILNIDPEMAQKHLEPLNTTEIKTLNADEVLEGIRKGKFDIVSGDLQK